MFVWIIFSEPWNILLPNLVWWCSIMSQSVIQKKLFAVFKVVASARAHIIKYDSSYSIFWTADSSATKHGLMIYHLKPEYLLKKSGLQHSRSRSQQKHRNVNVHLDDIFLTMEHFVTKPSIVMHHLELECHAKRLVCYFQGQGHSKGSYDQNMTVSTVSSELLILLLLDFV